MSPTLAHGDQVLVFRHWPAKWLRRGQIVVVWPWYCTEISGSELFGGISPFIKRVHAIPGDVVTSYLSEVGELHRSIVEAEYNAEGSKTWQIDPGLFFVRGDCAQGGFDSLVWGPIAFDRLLGIVIAKLPRK